MQPPSPAIKDSWPPDYVSAWAWRQQQLRRLRRNPKLIAGAKQFYRGRAAEFIVHWCDTYDPRRVAKGLPARFPFILFPRQVEFLQFLEELIAAEEGGLVEKARDMGATWLCAAFSVHMWLFREGSSIGWGSRKEQLVDRIGDPDSIFEKMRMIILGLPPEFWPVGFNPDNHLHFMRFVNPETGATITGEAGDNIGRGGRKSAYFLDEAAHIDRPEKVEAALGDNTRVRIDISSVNGPGNVFHRRREAGVEWTGGSVVAGRANVFVMDWRDHPEKDEAWYAARRNKASADGLMHVFAQEVDRNYFAAVDGTIISAEWFRAAIDAHVKLGFPIRGNLAGGLDVADEGGDRNALALRRGPVLLRTREWPDGDVGKTARRAFAECEEMEEPIELQYDCVGVGAGVKAEANRLAEEGKMPKALRLTAWSAGASPLDPDGYVEPDDDETPLNGDFYSNLKAQAWWQLRRRFEKTWRAVVEGTHYDPDELISIPSDLPQLRQIEKELCQPTASRTSGALKLVVDKKPSGARSPNVGDAIVMAYWPVVEPERAAISVPIRGLV